jgi:hypothetical protein
MSSTVRGFNIRDLTQHGKAEIGRVSVATAVTLPATTTANLFTVVGAIEVSGLFGFVTTVFGVTATTVQLGWTPTLGGAANNAAIAAASANLASTAVGAVIIPPLTLGAALPAPVTALETAVSSCSFAVENGNITWTTSGTDTGAVTWLLAWQPLFPKTNYSAGSGGPTVTAA